MLQTILALVDPAFNHMEDNGAYAEYDGLFFDKFLCERRAV